MKLRIRMRRVDSLIKKGVKEVIEVGTEDLSLSTLKDVKEYVNYIAKEISEKLGVEIVKIEFQGNEDIGARYILYRFRLYTKKGYIACRVVTYFNKHIQTILTVGG
ncbi:TPA: hypothetical protein EYP83_00185 [Candidatus Geothermarchaeota archaeon]|nr:hypothetical protein [Candidatus Geothermarchaeota archaeon]HIQ13092.1 hypothetical protein [Thermoprotei archaeon]